MMHDDDRHLKGMCGVICIVEENFLVSKIEFWTRLFAVWISVTKLFDFYHSEFLDDWPVEEAKYRDDYNIGTNNQKG